MTLKSNFVMYFKKIVQKLLMGALTFLIASNVWADCASGAIWFWPESKQIVPSQVIIATCYGNLQEIAVQMGGKYRPFLINGQERIPLVVVETCVGEFFQTQAIMRPATPLLAGKQYRLQIDGLPTGEVREDGEPWVTKEMLPTWKVAGAADATAPTWKSAPTVAGKNYVSYGCGPGVSVLFAVGSNEPVNALARVEVRAVGTDTWTRYYLPVQDGKVDVGHGMCSGAFAFSQPGKYEAKFILADASGNWSEWKGTPIVFEPPTEADQG